MAELSVVNLVMASQKKKTPKRTFTTYEKLYYNSELGHQLVAGGGSIESSPVVIESVGEASTGRIV